MKKILVAGSIENKQCIKDFVEKNSLITSRKTKLLLKNKKIQINGKLAYYDSFVRSGDTVVVDMSEESRDNTVPENIPINIIYEDEHFLVVNKPAGMLVHPTPNHPTGTLANAVKYYFAMKSLDIPVRLVNRIDMDTSGLVVIAKSGEAHAALAAQFQLDSCEKYYLAVVEGCLTVCNGVIDKPIGVDDESSIRRAVKADGQRSITEFEVLEQYKSAALLKLKLITGRTHQIRVHMCSIGHPLLGDKLYGGNVETIERQALHAFRMVFQHPYDNSIVTLETELPQDMQELIYKLRKN